MMQQLTFLTAPFGKLPAFAKNRFLWGFDMPIVFSVLALLSQASLAAQDPADIKGVKWKQNPVGFLEDKIDWWLEKPAGTSMRDVVQALKSKGVNAVVIRVDKKSRFKGTGSTQTNNYNKAMDEIAKAVGILKDEGVNAYLWARIWLEYDGAPRQGTVDATVDSVRDRFKPVLDRLKNNGDLDGVTGLALIETNCDHMQDVRMYAKKIANKFNNESNWKANGQGFFKTRTFLVPGAGFGLDFRNINDSSFLSAMQNKTKYFAFIYKYMRATHESVTNGDYDGVTLSDGKSYNWSDMEKNRSSFTVDLRKEYLNHFNLDGLVWYVNQYSQYSRANHVVFWGDKWDAISQTPQRSRQALYDILVKNGGNIRDETKGKFFCMTAVKSATAGQSIQRMSYLQSDLNVNSYPSRSAGMSVGEAWQRWGTWVNPGY